MRKIKVWLLFIIFMCNLSYNTYAMERSIYLGGNLFQKPSEVTNNSGVTSKLIQYSNEYIAVNLDIPVISGLKNGDTEKSINDKIQSTILTIKDSVEKMAKEDSELNKKTGYDVRQYNVTSEYNISYNKDNLLSVVLTLYQYTGGAHGSTSKIAYNFDVNTGKYGVLQDFLGNNPDYRATVLKEIKTQMEKDIQKYFPDSIKNLNGIPYNQNFYLTDDGVIVYFGEYAIAPYASGISEFKIPYKKFPKGLNNNVKILKNPLEIQTETYISSEDGFQSYLSYPVIKADDNAIINNINKTIKEQVFSFNSLIKSKANEDKIKINESGEAKVWGASTYFKSYYVNKDLLSIVITYSGNNGTTENYDLYNKGYNINLRDGRIYKLKDVFKGDFNFISAINKEIKDQIKNLEMTLGHSNIYNFNSVSADTEFYIENGNLIITFPQGEIAPKEYYNPEFKIPLSKFQGNINKEFLEI